MHSFSILSRQVDIVASPLHNVSGGNFFEIYYLKDSLNGKILSDPFGKVIVLAQEKLNVQGRILHTCCLV